TGTASPSATARPTAARLNFTVRSGRPSLSASPIEVGAEASTGTLPFKRIEAMSMSAGEAGGSGSSVAVTQWPIERRLRVLGLRSKLIGVGTQLAAPMLSSTETVAEPATARSGLPSRLKSPIATERGKYAEPYTVFA